MAQARGAAGQAVDANVSDVDPLAASLRRVEPGNAQHSFNARLTTTDFGAGWTPYNRPNGSAEDRKYRYTSPGLTALIDRPDYLVATDEGLGLNVQPRRDGEQFMLIPANTVFSLTPYTPKRQEADLAPPPINLVERRLNLRVDRDDRGTLQNRFTGETSRASTPATPKPSLAQAIPAYRDGLGRQVFPGSVDRPTRVSVVDRKSREAIWSTDVPGGEKLIVFTPLEGPAKALIWERRPLSSPGKAEDGQPIPPLATGTIDLAGRMYLFDVQHPEDVATTEQD